MVECLGGVAAFRWDAVAVWSPVGGERRGKRKRLMSFLERTREGQQTDEHRDFQRRCWGNLRETGRSMYGLLQAHRYHLELNRADSTPFIDWETPAHAAVYLMLLGSWCLSTRDNFFLTQFHYKQ